MNPPRAANPPTGVLRSEKIAPRHHDRLAVVYVRQSTVQQILDHRESTRLQYGLVTRAEDLGWVTKRAVVIDDDPGQSGASAAGRVGFQRLVSEVSLDHVGLVLGVEMSRLAGCVRNGTTGAVGEVMGGVKAAWPAVNWPLPRP